MIRLFFAVAVLISVTSCGVERKIYSTTGKVTYLSCKDIWRSSNVLNLKIKSKDFDSILNYNLKLWNVDCRRALELIKLEQQITFQYIDGGRIGPDLVYLNVDGVDIVDDR